MMRNAMRGVVAGVAVAGLLGAASTAQATSFLTSGHGDIELLYDSVLDEWEFEILCEECSIDGVPIVGDQEFETDELGILVPVSTATTAVGDVGPIDDTPTGASMGETFYKLPETDPEAIAEVAPFLGWGLDEIDPGIFVAEEITMTLLSVSYSFMGSPGSADFSLYNSDAGLGGSVPHFWMSTADVGATINGDNSIVFDVGSHTHYNLGFTELGTYEITFEASGDLVAGGSTSSQGTVTFVVPEPGVAALVWTGLVGLSIRRSRRA